jgi:DNA-binding transcriptional ArsR family regulator
MSDDFDTLLGFFKALGNESRLKIIAILADEECTVRELAQRLNLKEPTVSEHLAMLKEAGLVTARAEGNFRYYAFNAKALIALNKSLLSRERLAALAPDDTSAREQKILNNYLDGERLTQIPMAHNKRLVILRWLADKFEFDRRYPEQEVNAIIKLHHPDYATLRRELIAAKLMAREKGIYWRLPPAGE